MTFAPKDIVAAVAVGPNDDVTLAEHLVDAACDIAARDGTDARVTLVYSAPNETPSLAVDTGLAPPTFYQAVADALEMNRNAARTVLDTLAKRARARGVAAVTTSILDPVEGVGEAIAHDAKARGADLIVLCSHSRRGLKRFFLGSVAERVAHLAEMPVLILRAP